jgi:hypothetical protein
MPFKEKTLFHRLIGVRRCSSSWRMGLSRSFFCQSLAPPLAGCCFLLPRAVFADVARMTLAAELLVGAVTPKDVAVVSLFSRHVSPIVFSFGDWQLTTGVVCAGSRQDAASAQLPPVKAVQSVRMRTAPFWKTPT